MVCKPCWELKYCPYGGLVEYFPLISKEDPVPLEQIERSYNSWLSTAMEGRLETKERVYEAIEDSVPGTFKANPAHPGVPPASN